MRNSTKTLSVCARSLPLLIALTLLLQSLPSLAVTQNEDIDKSTYGEVFVDQGPFAKRGAFEMLQDHRDPFWTPTNIAIVVCVIVVIVVICIVAIILLCVYEVIDCAFSCAFPCCHRRGYH
jgi:hypothetical protein